MRVPPDILRCPVTGGPLEASGDRLQTAGADRSYPVFDGVPILVSDEVSTFTAAQVVGTARPRPHSLGRSLAMRLVPATSLNPGARERFAAFADLVADTAGDRRARVLVIGGGELGSGMGEFARDGRLDLVETDVYLGSRVIVACDAHHLPFADGAFDAVLIQAVLEHVLDPQRVVDEIHRVLRRDGLVMAETPFMQQVHEGAFDFTRYTQVGHRRLFRRFAQLDSGVACGPGTALLWSLRYLARALPRRSMSAARVLDRVVTLFFFWLKYLDRVVAGHPGAHDAASSVFFVGRRQEHPVSDAEITGGYVGTLRSAAGSRGLTRS